ncbi:MAG: class A beta-lactamase-related serine hydrolase [Chloroflexota bacterium]|nr:class A beta-lactamase-related serine hydrolase [Chloroflexota bacterium]
MSAEWAALDRAAADLDGSAGLVVVDAAGAVLYEHDADGVYPSASVIKIPLLMTLYADAAAGRLSLDDRIAVGERMPGSGVLRHLPDVVADLSVRDHAMLMTIVSDNTSTNRLIERVGLGRVAERLAEWGCVRTQLRRKMFDFDAAKRGLDNVASAREMAGLMLRLVRGELVDRATSNAVLAVLEQTQDDALIRRYLPTGARVAHKTGSLEKVRNDAAVIWGTGPVVAAGFVNGVPDIRPARSLLGLLGWLAYQAAGGDAKGLPIEWPQAR